MAVLKNEPERVRVTLQADGPGPPVEVRLRRWLKAALRAWGLRCVRVEPADVERDTPGGQNDADAR